MHANIAISSLVSRLPVLVPLVPRVCLGWRFMVANPSMDPHLPPVLDTHYPCITSSDPLGRVDYSPGSHSFTSNLSHSF